jgi:GNAT superfamily N-acetyltransferase
VANAEVQVREFQSSDAAACEKLMHKCIELFKESNGGHMPDKIVDGILKPNWHARRLNDLCEKKQAYRWVAIQDGKIVGMMGVAQKPGRHRFVNSLRIKGDSPEFEKFHGTFTFFVDPAYRHKEIGRTLITAVKNACRRKGIPGLFYPSEPSACPGFSKLGFEHRPDADYFFPKKVRLPEGFHDKWLCGHYDDERRGQISARGRKIKHMYFVMRL